MYNEKRCLHIVFAEGVHVIIEISNKAHTVQYYNIS